MGERVLYVERERLTTGSLEARARTKPEMIARLGALHSEATVDFGVTAGLVDMYIVVALPSGERVVEVIHLPHLAAEWASKIESEASR